MIKLSVVLLTRDEEENIKACLASIKDIADEIVVVDEGSRDKTREIAKSFGARVYTVKHEPIFHVNKQIALEKATGDWVLQLDADERVTTKLAQEIKRVINMNSSQVNARELKDKKKKDLLERHQKLLDKRDGKIGRDSGTIVAFFLPRLNFFLGKPLKYAGVYPDANIRLIKRGKARFPAKSVHEQMKVDGKVAWLFNDLEHHDSPTLSRYLERANRYTDLHAQELQSSKVSKNPFMLVNYSILKPLGVFFKLFIRHKGVLDGTRGFLWSLLSASHFPFAYYKYLTMSRK